MTVDDLANSPIVPESLDLFLRQLESLGLKRISIEQVRRAFFEIHPELLDHPDRNNHLKDALDVLVKSQCVAYPSDTKTNWDLAARPKIPGWISLKSNSGRQPIDPYSIAWVKELSFCTRLRNRAQLEAAIRINEYLINNRGSIEELLPIRERSLQIFGDEKRLDSLVSGDSLLGGMLPLKSLGAIVIAPPIPFESIEQSGKSLLIVENHNTYWSMCKWNRAVHRYTAIAWGGGNAILRNGAGIAQLLQAAGATGVDYFGDLDLRGLQIMHSLINLLKAQFQIEAVPADSFYEWLILNGCRCPSAAVTESTAIEPVLVNFSPLLADQICSLLKSGQRIPQESLNSSILGRFELRAHDCANPN